MFIKFDEMQQFGARQFEAITTATTSTNDRLHAIATETVDYSKRSLDNGRAYAEKLLRVRKPAELAELQIEFAKASYDDLIAQTKKVLDLYSNLPLQLFVAAKATTPAASPSNAAASSKQS
jgi:hypothetical protein